MGCTLDINMKQRKKQLTCAPSFCPSALHLSSAKHSSEVGGTKVQLFLRKVDVQVAKAGSLRDREGKAKHYAQLMAVADASTHSASSLM